MPMGFEPGTWWDAQCAAGGVPGQGQSMVADGGLTTARLRDGDAPLLGTPMLSQVSHCRRYLHRASLSRPCVSVPY